MSCFGRKLTWVLAGLLVLAAVPLRAQENLDSGKSAAQLFASDCAICHKSPKGLVKPGAFSGLDGFLREHYTASRESAAVLAAFLRAAGPAPVERARATKRTGKGDDKGKSGAKKPAAGKPGGEGKPSEAKPSETKPSETKPAEAKPSETKPSDAKPAETKPSEAKPAEAKPAEAKPSEAKPSETKPSETKPSAPKAGEGGKSD